MFHLMVQWCHQSVLLFHKQSKLLWNQGHWRSQPKPNKQLWSIHLSIDAPPLQPTKQGCYQLPLCCNRINICQQGERHMSEHCSSRTSCRWQPAKSRRCQQHEEICSSDKDLLRVVQQNRSNHKSHSHKQKIPLPEILCFFALNLIHVLPHFPGMPHETSLWTSCRWQLERTARHSANWERQWQDQSSLARNTTRMTLASSPSSLWFDHMTRTSEWWPCCRSCSSQQEFLDPALPYIQIQERWYS